MYVILVHHHQRQQSTTAAFITSRTVCSQQKSAGGIHYRAVKYRPQCYNATRAKVIIVISPLSKLNTCKLANLFNLQPSNHNDHQHLTLNDSDLPSLIICPPCVHCSSLVSIRSIPSNWFKVNLLVEVLLIDTPAPHTGPQNAHTVLGVCCGFME